MSPRKAFIIIGVLVVLAIVLFVFQNISGKDTTRPALDTIMSTNAVIISLSDQASQNASLYEVQTAAATLLATTTSDNELLQAYYKDRYGKESKLAENKLELDELKNTAPGVGYDAKFKSLVTEHLKTNQTNLTDVYDATKSQALKDLLSTIYNNQEAALKSFE